MREWLETIFDDMDFPMEARESLLKDYDKITLCPAFVYPLNQYNQDLFLDHKAARENLTDSAPSYGVHPYAALFLVYCCMAYHLKDLYIQKEISLEIWKDTMKDARCKLMECHNVYGIWGSFVTHWIPRFFEMTCFGIGRLEFEVIPSPISCSELSKGEKAINIHIPSRGPLYEEEITDSFTKAKEFFRDQVPKGIFVCHSWLLNPDLPLFLDTKSRILAFQRRFIIEEAHDDPSFGDCWRIYNIYYDKHPENLPRETALQRAYADWLAAGHQPKCGFGWLKA